MLNKRAGLFLNFVKLAFEKYKLPSVAIIVKNGINYE